jgi:superfamily II DNA or RNA helicase
MRDIDNKALLDAAQGVLPEGSAFVLVPFLRFRDGVVTLSLRAGEGRLSFIRDLPGFLNALQSCSPFLVSRHFTFSPAWMRLDNKAELLCRLLQSYIEAKETSPQALSGAQRRDLPLSGGFLSLVLDSLRQMYFILSINGENMSQQGIEEQPLPLLFRAGYDIRGVILYGMWQEPVSGVSSDGRYALIDRRLVRLSAQDRALLQVLPDVPDGEEFTYRFNREDTSRVFSDFLPWLQHAQAVVFEDELSQRLLRYPLKPKVYLDREGEGIAARIVFCYGAYEANPFEPDAALPAYLFRDASGERQLMDLLALYGFRARTGRADLQEADLIFEFLMKGVAELHHLGEVYLSSAFRQLTPRAPSFSGHFRLKAGRIGLELADEGQITDEMMPLLKALSKRKKYFRYRNGAFITLEDAREWQALAEAYLQSVNKEDERDLPAMRAHYLSALVEKSGLPVTFDPAARTAVNLDPEHLDSPVRGLFDYQLRGFRWICALNMLGLGGILADEMGLGKTAQMIAAIEYFSLSEPVRLPTLIVSPTTLLYNWLSEIVRFAPGLSASVISGSRAVREKAMEKALDSGKDILITSYPLLRQDIGLYKDVRFRFAVLDEAQNIKNFTSQTARAAKRLDAQTRLALTGTPMENNVSELWSLFDFVLPGYFDSARDFLRKYEDGRHAEELRLRIRPFLMRRLKSDVMSELPDKLETTLYCEMGSDQRRVYQAALLKSRAWVNEILSAKGLDGSRIEVLAAITLLRQICCYPGLSIPEYSGESAKLELLMDVLPESLRNGRRVLVFSQFTTMLKIIRERMDRAGIPSLYLDGETPAQERLELADRFNRGGDPVFLISLKAGGTGLNLTGADMVIHYDPWWNPTAEDQANDRAHRIGQEKTVQIIHLITLRSIEEAVVEMGRRKRRLFDRLITPGETIPQKLSREDVLRLFEK